MAYKAYITEALVCGSTPHHTSDRSYLLFSREAGMVWATAKSVREERSKQRYALQDFSYARVTLVKGKSGWRLAGAEALSNVYMETELRGVRVMVWKIVGLIRRFVQGEVPHTQMFDDVLTAFKEASLYDPVKLESILTLRILYELGYIAPSPLYDELLTVPRWNTGVDALSATNLERVQEAITHALGESHL